MDRINTDVSNAIYQWNHSSLSDKDLVIAESAIRASLAEAKELTPPEDYSELQLHLVSAIQAVLYAAFGVVDENESHREGSNNTYQSEFDKAWAAWDDANAKRGATCK